MSAAITQLLGDKLLSSAGECSTSDALRGKVVGIYFSAHWCPPCRGFTPKLAEVYKGLKAKGKPFEIVFVSSDRDEESFAEYFGEQPWLALPYAEREKKGSLSKKYKVSGIPTLVIVDEEGGTISTDGRSVVMEDPEGAEFPWKPPTIWEALGEEVIKADGESLKIANLSAENDVLALYFSAHWCPPCKGFTPKLAATYEKVVAAGKKLAVVFISSDKSAAEFQEYLGSMPASWGAIPSGDKRKNLLSRRFDVEGIPTLVILDAKTGAVINANGRGAVMADPDGAQFPWEPPAVAELSATADGINETPSVCLLLEEVPADKAAPLLAVLTPAAEAAKAAGEDLLYFKASANDGPVGQVRKLTKVGEASAEPALLILDIPNNGGYFTCDGPVTPDSLLGFIADYKAGKLERKQLG